MKKIFVLVLILLPVFCFSQIWPIEGLNFESVLMSFGPDARTMTVKDLSDDFLTFLKKHKITLKSPGYVNTDFNSDGIKDYAFIVRSDVVENGVVVNFSAQAIALISEGSNYRKYFLGKYKSLPDNLSLESFTGTWQGRTFKTPVIMFKRFHADSAIAYWNSKIRDFEWVYAE